jgi:hypothetical protein
MRSWQVERMEHKNTKIVLFQVENRFAKNARMNPVVLAPGDSLASIGVLVLGGLKRLESRWKQDRHATLSLTVDASGPTEDELTIRLQAIGYEIRPWTVGFVDLSIRAASAN